MSTLLPLDENGRALPVLRLRADGAHEIAATAAAQRIGPFAADTRVIGVYATGPVRIATGNDTVTAVTDGHYLPEGVHLSLSLGGDAAGRHDHLSALAEAADCRVYVSEME